MKCCWLFPSSVETKQALQPLQLGEFSLSPAQSDLELILLGDPIFLGNTRNAFECYLFVLAVSILLDRSLQQECLCIPDSSAYLPYQQLD